MSEELSNDFVVLTDDEGNEIEFEHIDTMELDGQTYMAFIPAEITVEDEAEVVVLKVVEENGEELLVSIEDEVELLNAYNGFMDRLEDMYEMEDEA